MRRMLLIAVLINTLSIFSCYAQQDIAVIQQQEKYGLIDNRGAIILPCKYDYLAVSCSDLILCKQWGKYGFVDFTGSSLIDFVYDSAGVFYKDTAWVQKDGKVGFIDRTGTLFIDYLYDEADFFSEGIAAVKVAGKWGIIDNKGTYLLDPQYEYIFTPKVGYTIVGNNAKKSLWSVKDAFIYPQWKYDYLDNFYKRPGMFVATEIDGNRRGYLMQVKEGEMYSSLDSSYVNIVGMPSVFELDTDCSPVVNLDYIIFRDTTYEEGILNPSFEKIISGYKEVKYLSPYHFLCTKKEGYYDPLEK